MSQPLRRPLSARFYDSLSTEAERGVQDQHGRQLPVSLPGRILGVAPTPERGSEPCWT